MHLLVLYLFFIHFLVNEIGMTTKSLKGSDSNELPANWRMQRKPIDNVRVQSKLDKESKRSQITLIRHHFSERNVLYSGIEKGKRYNLSGYSGAANGVVIICGCFTMAVENRYVDLCSFPSSITFISLDARLFYCHVKSP